MYGFSLKKTVHAFAVIFLCSLMLCACGVQKTAPPAPSNNNPTSLPTETFILSSPAFQSLHPIPKKYSCDGQNVSPQLDWAGIPQGTLSIALVMDDPDAPNGTFIHWVLYNIPPDRTGLPEAVTDVGTGGANSLGKGTYTGPCPPTGKPHHYHFKLYVVNLPPNLPGGLNPAQLLDQLHGHILAYGELIGLYQR
jgi:Raf kinase inhibitor-like YbhB/YbcL family protein